MSCVHPKWIEWYSMFVPCGKCIACKKSRAKEWTARLIHELNYSSQSLYVTLTYDEENFPENGSISKEELQKYIKRLRKRSEKALRYFACGEYGELSFRPHYHLIIFGLSYEDAEIVEKCWTKGFCHIGSVTHESIAYVAGYVQKKLKDMREYVGIQKPFQVQSQRLGLKWAEDNKDFLEQNHHIKIGGFPQGIPRYYRKKFEMSSDVVEKRLIRKRKEFLDRWRDRVPKEELFEIWKKAHYQRELNMIGADELAKRRGS